jgi:hypothetical protein
MRCGRVAGLAGVLSAATLLFTAGSALAASAEIHGKATDSSGDPIAGLTVCAEGLYPLLPGDCDWQTDAEGRYSIAGLREGSYRVGFHVEGSPSLNYVPQWYPGKAHPEEADPVELAEGQSKEINAQLQAGGEVSGKVVSQKAGHLPIEGVVVCAEEVDYFQTGEVGYCGRSNAAGEFRIRNLGTGHYRLEFQTEGDVNFVEESFPEPPGFKSITAGDVIEVEAFLIPGVQIEGTVTDQVTEDPIGTVPPPGSSPAVCALNPTTEARVKCASPDGDGHYVIGGLPAGTYAVAFALDWVEEGMVLHPDGFVRRYWDEVPSIEEATLLTGTGGQVIDGIDAVLTKGDEVFPHCEVASACPEPPPIGEIPAGNTLDLPTTPLLRTVTSGQPARGPRCKKGFHRVVKSGKTRCVKVAKKNRHRRPHRQSAR